MYTLAATIVWGVLNPAHLITLLALIGLGAFLLRRQGAALAAFSFSAVLLIVFGVLPAGQWLMAPLENRYPGPPAEDVQSARGIIILGGTERPAMSVARQQPILGDSAMRLIAGAALAHRFPEKPVVYSGGSPDRESGHAQADVAKDVLSSLLVKGPRVRYERESMNTHDNAIMTRDLVSPAPGEPWLLVTSGYHMPRAVAAFEAAGWAVIPYPVDYRTAPGDQWSWVPNVSMRLREAELAVHEWVGLAVYWLMGRTQKLFP